MSMDASRLQVRAAVPPVVVAAPPISPLPVAALAPVAAPIAPPQPPQPVGKLDAITLGILSGVRPCSTAVKAVAIAAMEEKAAEQPQPLPQRPIFLAVAAAVVGGAVWLLTGVRGKAAPIPTTITRPALAAPNIPMPTHIPTRSSPLARSEFAGFVVVGG